MPGKIIIFGATGLIGKKLTAELIINDYYVIVIARNTNKAKQLFSQPEGIEIINSDNLNTESLSKLLDSSLAIINVSGESLGRKRWNAKVKKLIYDSRINSTQFIIDALKICENKPEVFMSASAVGYYGSDEYSDIDETFPAGNDFLAKLCKDWESTALKATELGVRTICMRTGIVLDKNEGALKRILLPFKLFIGGKQGTGKQWVSWIHINDLARLIIFTLENKNIEKSLNATSPNAVTNETYCRTIAKILNRPMLFTIPGFILKIILGEFAEYILTGQKVIPAKALKYGFKFEYENIKDALSQIINNK